MTQPSLLVIQTASVDDDAALAALDVVLSAAALDIPVQMLFSDAALSCLSAKVSSDPQLGVKSWQKKYQLFELYDIPAPWVALEDLDRLKLYEDELSVPVAVKSLAEMAELSAKFKHVMRF